MYTSNHAHGTLFPKTELTRCPLKWMNFVSVWWEQIYA